MLALVRKTLKEHGLAIFYAYLILLAFIYISMLSFVFLSDLYIGDFRFLSPIVLFLLAFPIRLFAWLGVEIEKLFYQADYKVSIKHYLNFTYPEDIPYFSHHYWLKTIAYVAISILSLLLLFIFSMVTFFLPLSLYKAFYLLLPYLAVLQQKPLAALGIGKEKREFIKFNFDLTKKYRWKIFFIHFLVYNFFFGLYLINYFHWKVSLQLGFAWVWIALPLVITGFILLHWLFMNLWTQVLIREKNKTA